MTPHTSLPRHALTTTDPTDAQVVPVARLVEAGLRRTSRAIRDTARPPAGDLLAHAARARRLTELHTAAGVGAWCWVLGWPSLVVTVAAAGLGLGLWRLASVPSLTGWLGIVCGRGGCAGRCTRLGCRGECGRVS